MPLTPTAARALRAVDTPLYEDVPDRRIARALAWLGYTVTLDLRFGRSVTGVVAGVATVPHLKVGSVGPGMVLLQRGGVGVDVLEGYLCGTIERIREAAPRRPPEPRDDDRRERFD